MLERELMVTPLQMLFNTQLNSKNFIFPVRELHGQAHTSKTHFNNKWLVIIMYENKYILKS